MGVMKTIQLRRYTLVEGEYDAFVSWWGEWMPKVRPASGFAIEFAYGLRETNEFVWAVSAPGDEASFLEREKTYLASDDRAAHHRSVHGCVRSTGGTSSTDPVRTNQSRRSFTGSPTSCSQARA